MSVHRILKQLQLKKVCARWVPRTLTDAHKEARITVRSEPLEQHEKDVIGFFYKNSVGR